MEVKVPRPRGRPRKRPRPEDDNAKLNGKLDNRGKKRNLEVKPSVPISLLGRYVLKDFDDNGVFLGKIVSYETGFYKVEYEDGDCEELESRELRPLIIQENYFDDELYARKNKLDGYILKKDEKKKMRGVEASTAGNPSGGQTIAADMVEVEDGVHSSSDFSEDDGVTDPDTEREVPYDPPIDLPPSSGTIGVPDESVAHLLSVYGFLRSFSVQLYLCPFGLDDFVGALNFTGPNYLLEAIHVALLRALKRHLERLPSDGSELASKCLKCIDWSLLDALTWPVYLVQYFTAMGHATELQWKSFYECVVEKEYYSLPAGMKLKILQILCDDVFDVAELRSEIDVREESEVGFDPDGVTADLPESVPRRVHPRFAKTSAWKEKEGIGIVAVNNGMNDGSNNLDLRSTKGDSNGVTSDLDGNSDECRLCGMDGTLLCCDGCPSAYHSRCIGVVKMYIPDGPWYCPECTINKVGPTIAHGTSLRGAVSFGTDPHGQLFLGTCNHLLVLRTCPNAEADVKYYNVNDIPKVVHVLLSATNHRSIYVDICESIAECWNLPAGLSSYLRAAKADMNREDGEETDMIKLDIASNVRISGVTYTGSSFKPHSYINHYGNGELAATAAVTLAQLSSEETHEPEIHKYSNSARKAASSNILLQVKAFSLVASRFFWPSSEKKDNIARERCGWCHSCKLTSASRRGCLLNAAVTGATKSATKMFSSLLPLRNGEGSLSSIAAYMLYLEESLRGLIAGPFLSEGHRKLWCKQVEEASSYKAIKPLLLQLEENICSIALSSDWIKLTDDWLIEHSIFQSTPFNFGATQKRGPGRRRQRNPAEATVEGSDDDGFTWWRGGKLSKLILLKAVVSRGYIKKAACQGGVKRIRGFNYGDASGIPKRSRQCVWKAAVECSKNISQLALQVRYLDMNIRWSELVRPEQNLQEVKGSETEASVFRNASICDKSITDTKIRYGVVFGNQKHLPSRVMKNVIDAEKMLDGNVKYWFQESRVPLYLIKEYEENLQRVPLASSTQKPFTTLSKMQRKQLKASRSDTFSYLASKRDNMEKCSCASCHLHVLLRDATTCSSCRGYCHKECTLSSQHTNGKVEVVVTCKQCYNIKARSLINTNFRHSTTTTTTPMGVVNGQHQQHTSTPILKPLNHQLTFQRTPPESAPGLRLATTPSSSVASKSRQKTLSWGVIWRKKSSEDTGVGFRGQHILLSGGRSDNKPHVDPVCWICQQPYNPALSYIHCFNCDKWYHIAAIRLEESKICEVVGYKCCKCRRIRSPDCPFMDPKLKEQKLMKKSSVARSQKQGWDSDSERMSEPKDSKPSTPSFLNNDVYIPEDDPLLVSVSKVEEFNQSDADLEWNSQASAPIPQKLPVRRQVKREDTSGNNLSEAELLSFPEPQSTVTAEGEQTLPVMEWDVSGNAAVEGELMFDYGTLNYEDMEFEPQTYFSLTELLTTEDGDKCGIGDEGGRESGEPTASSMGVNASSCQICSHREPVPELVCRVCGLVIHSHCCPWEEDDESSCSQGGWSCGRCREWQ